MVFLDCGSNRTNSLSGLQSGFLMTTPCPLTTITTTKRKEPSLLLPREVQEHFIPFRAFVLFVQMRKFLLLHCHTVGVLSPLFTPPPPTRSCLVLGTDSLQVYKLSLGIWVFGSRGLYLESVGDMPYEVLRVPLTRRGWFFACYNLLVELQWRFGSASGLVENLSYWAIVRYVVRFLRRRKCVSEKPPMFDIPVV